ncbi:MAG: 6-phosphogluconolactonase [Nitriliruptoraceae bacterium]
MRVEVVAPEAYDEVAGDHLAEMVLAALDERRSASLAVSGGTTPDGPLTAFADHDLDWDRVHLFQVDERVAPDGHEDRNLTMLLGSLAQVLDRVTLDRMRVTDADLTDAAAAYADRLRSVAGTPARLDGIQLGLGTDGHTASLVPGDAVLEVSDTEVAVTGPYQGRQRLTLTAPTLRAARRRLWLVRGEDKAAAVRGLLAGDLALPATRVAQPGDVLLLDEPTSRAVRS